MQKFKVNIKGVTPYMQHRMDAIKLKEWEEARGLIIERLGLNDEHSKTAAFHSYIDKDGKFFIPSEHFQQSFIKGGSMVKGKVGGTTKSMKQIVAGMFSIVEDHIPFRPFDEVDERSAVNKNVKARVMVYRPKWITWSCEFTLEVDNDTITVKTIENIIECAGKYLGVGSYRPEHTGKFGRFEAVLTKI